MKMKFTIALACAFSMHAYAQVGVSVAPFLFSTAYMSQMYDKTNGFGNNALGFSACTNINNRIYGEVSWFRIMGERKRTFSDNYGYGVPGGFTHRNLNWLEMHFDYALVRKPWHDLEKWAPALAVRGGVIFNTRMTMLAPQVGRDSVYTQQPPYVVDSIAPLNRYDLTGLRQQMITAGISIKIMRKKTVNMSGGFLYFKELATGSILTVVGGHSGRSNYYRVRQWDFYADFLYATNSVYDDYLGWNDYRRDTRQISGDAIPGKESFGWRIGVKHVAFNPLGLQWVIEYQQLPGQKQYGGIEDIDEPARKNRFLIIGLNMSIGYNSISRDY